MRILLYISILILSYSCNPPKKVTKSQGENDSPVITLQKTMCYGKCPVYTITIHGNGQSVYVGKKNVDKIGKYEKRLEKVEATNLIKAFEEANFFDFQDEYTAKITDLPTTYITFSSKGKTKKIRDYYGAPEELKKLEKLVEDIANSEGWTKINQE